VHTDIQEIFGSQFELPELGHLGTHGLANPRDFESPVASFDVDQSPWKSACSSLMKQNAFSDIVIPYTVIYKYVKKTRASRLTAN
jgi:homogentisate 1,2-dioxygenase